MIADLMCQLQDRANEQSEGVTDERNIEENEATRPILALVEEHIPPGRGSKDFIIPSIVIHPPPVDPPAPPPDIPTSELSSEDPVPPVQSIFGDHVLAQIRVARHEDHLDYTGDFDGESSYEGLESDEGLVRSRASEGYYSPNEEGYISSRERGDAGSMDPSFEETLQERERAVLQLKELYATEDDGLNELVNELILSFESPESDQLSSIVDDGSDSMRDYEYEDDDGSGEADNEYWLYQLFQNTHDWRETHLWHPLEDIAEEGENGNTTLNAASGTLVNGAGPGMGDFEEASQNERLEEGLDTLNPHSKTAPPLLRNCLNKRKPTDRKDSLSPSNIPESQQPGKRRRSCIACYSSSA